MSEQSYGEKLRDREAVMKALREGIRDAVRMHKFLGNPVSTFRDGKVVWIAPENINDDGTVDFPQSDT